MHHHPRGELRSVRGLRTAHTHLPKPQGDHFLGNRLEPQAMCVCAGFRVATVFRIN